MLKNLFPIFIVILFSILLFACSSEPVFEEMPAPEEHKVIATFENEISLIDVSVQHDRVCLFWFAEQQPSQNYAFDIQFTNTYDTVMQAHEEISSRKAKTRAWESQAGYVNCVEMQDTDREWHLWVQLIDPRSDDALDFFLPSRELVRYGQALVWSTEVIDIVLDVNTATLEELEALPGMYSGYAERIINFRQEHGPFLEKIALLENARVPVRTYQRIYDHITVGDVPAMAEESMEEEMVVEEIMEEAEEQRVDDYLEAICYDDASGNQVCGLLAFVYPTEASQYHVELILDRIFDNEVALYLNIVELLINPIGSSNSGPKQVRLTEQTIDGKVCLPAATGQGVVFPDEQNGENCDAYAIFTVSDPYYSDTTIETFGSDATTESFIQFRGYWLEKNTARRLLSAAMEKTFGATPPLLANDMNIYVVEGEPPADYTGVIAQGQADGLIQAGDHAEAYSGLLTIVINLNPDVQLASQDCTMGGESNIARVYCPDETPRWIYAANAPIESFGGKSLGRIPTLVDLDRAQVHIDYFDLNLIFEPGEEPEVSAPTACSKPKYGVLRVGYIGNFAEKGLQELDKFAAPCYENFSLLKLDDSDHVMLALGREDVTAVLLDAASAEQFDKRVWAGDLLKVRENIYLGLANENEAELFLHIILIERGEITLSAAAELTEEASVFIEEHDFIMGATGNPDFAAAGIADNGEILVAMTESDRAGNILAVTGSVWLSPEGNSIVLYFSDDGLPVKAISQDHIALIRNHTNTSADIALIAPNGEIEILRDVPMENARILEWQKNSATRGAAKLAALMRAEEGGLTVSEAMTLAEIGFGVFSCAATVGSGGTLGVIFGVGCVGTGIHVFSTIKGEDAPALEAASLAGHGTGCIGGMITKEVTSVGDCAAAASQIATQVSGDILITEGELDPAIEEAIIALDEYIEETPPQTLAESFVGAKGAVSYHRVAKANDGSHHEETTITRYEEIVEAVDAVTVGVKVSYAGDGAGLIDVDDVWYYHINLETGEIDYPDHVGLNETSVTSRQIHEYEVTGYEEIEGWEYVGQGTRYRDLATYLTMSYEMSYKTYDPEGNYWGTYTDTMELIELNLP